MKTLVHMVRTDYSNGKGIKKTCTCGWTFKAQFSEDYRHVLKAGNATSKHLKDSYVPAQNKHSEKPSAVYRKHGTTRKTVSHRR